MTRKAKKYLLNLFATALAFGCVDLIWGEIGRMLSGEYFWWIRGGIWFSGGAILGLCVWRFCVRWNDGDFLFDD
jgi:hypothetical protein